MLKHDSFEVKRSQSTKSIKKKNNKKNNRRLKTNVVSDVIPTMTEKRKTRKDCD